MVPGASCLRTVDGEELVTSATPARANGLYTAVAASGEFLVVDGIVASPFAVARVLRKYRYKSEVCVASDIGNLRKHMCPNS